MSIRSELAFSWLVFLFAAGMFLCAEQSRADYHSYNIRTVEWLVDNSDIIAIVRGTGSEREVVQCLKGDPVQLAEELKRPEPDGASWHEFNKNGRFRLLFVRERSILL